MYPGFCEGHKLLQIQLIQAHVLDLLDLNDMDEKGMAEMLGHLEGKGTTTKRVKILVRIFIVVGWCLK